MEQSDKRIADVVELYRASGIESQIDYDKFYLYSIITHSTAIEGSTITEVENCLLFDQGIATPGKSMLEQMMNLDLKEAYIHGLQIAKTSLSFTPALLREIAAKVMRRTGSAFSTIAGKFDSSKGDFRLCNVSAGAGGRSYLNYLKVDKAVDEWCKWINESLKEIDRNDIAAGYRLSFEAHFRLVTIHPWVDGNGRTTRLVMNIIQHLLGLPMSVVRKEDKALYIQALIDSREADDSRTLQDFMLARQADKLENEIYNFKKSME